MSEPPPEVLVSMEALHRAWRLVRRNGSAPGSDGMTTARFERHLEAELERLRDQILSGKYHSHPIKRFYVPKDSGKNRPLSLWALRDRIAQRVIHDYLTPILEGQFLTCSYGFRPERSVEDAVEAIVRERNHNRRWVVDGDIRDCFDSIPINLLMSQVRTLVPSRLAVRLIYQWLRTPIEGQYGERAGVSQGSVISPQLANLYLHRFDQMIVAALPEARLIRFADDFVILCRQRADANWALKVAQQSLASLKLQLNRDKTRIVHFQEGFTFLGVTFKGSHLSGLPNQKNGGKQKE
jgi:group II intron reverse transcriptase/maturase